MVPPCQVPFKLSKGCLTCGFQQRGNVMELVALICTRRLLAMGLGWLTELEGERRGQQLSGDWRFPIFSCNSFHKFVHSECIINKQWAACSLNVCCCRGSYILLLSNVGSVIYFDQRKTVQLSSLESVHLFQPLDGIHGSAKHHYEQVFLEVYLP